MHSSRMRTARLLVPGGQGVVTMSQMGGVGGGRVFVTWSHPWGGGRCCDHVPGGGGGGGCCNLVSSWGGEGVGVVTMSQVGGGRVL